MAHSKRTCAETLPDSKRPKQAVLKRRVELGVEAMSVIMNFQHWGVIIGGDSAYEVDIGRDLNNAELEAFVSFRSENAEIVELVKKIEELKAVATAVIGPEGVVAKKTGSLVPTGKKARLPDEYGSVQRRKPGGRKDLGFETEKTDEEINEFIKEWVKENDDYHVLGCSGKNCQHFAVDIVYWLSDGKCTLLTQFEDWPTERSEKVETVKTLRHAEKNGFPRDYTCDEDFTWNRRFGSLEKQFAELAERTMVALKCISVQPGADRMLKLYGLFKQFWDGDVKGTRPLIFNQEHRKKWDAHAQFSGWTQTQCMAEYKKESRELQGEFLKGKPHLRFEP